MYFSLQLQFEMCKYLWLQMTLILLLWEWLWLLCLYFHSQACLPGSAHQDPHGVIQCFNPQKELNSALQCHSQELQPYATSKVAAHFLPSEQTMMNSIRQEMKLLQTPLMGKHPNQCEASCFIIEVQSADTLHYLRDTHGCSIISPALAFKSKQQPIPLNYLSNDSDIR